VSHEPPPGDAGIGGHLDLDTLAELDEGLQPAAEAARLDAHLSECRPCREHQARLRSTRALLGSLPAVPMPAEVADRLDAALAGAATTATVVPLSARRGWRAHPTAAGLAAAAAGVALITAVVLGSTLHSSNPPAARSEARAASAQDALAAIDLPVTSTGNHYTSGNLRRLVPRLVSPAAKNSIPQSTAPQSSAGVSTLAVPAFPPALARLHDSPEELRGCVAAVEKGGALQSPLSVDFADYAGRPSVIIVLPGLDSANIDAWIVGPGCSLTDADLLTYKSMPDPRAG
jgi:hypothetical protein